MQIRWPKLDLKTALAANALVLGIWVYAYAVHARALDFYYRTMQEDEHIEWSTFWAFLLAATMFLVTAVRQRRKQRTVPWFACGLALFCFVVAMEEISWGQRVLGFRPPIYFLENNFQQELNFHNVIDTSTRKTLLKALFGGFGVALPLIALLAPVRAWLRKLGILTPPIVLVLAFAVTVVIYHVYPFSLTGEWTELMFGICMLFVAVLAAHRLVAGDDPRGDTRLVVAWWLVVLALGLAHTTISHALLRSNPEMIAATESETEALRRDFASGKAKNRCNLHKRVYTFVEEYDSDYLLEGAFAGLVTHGLPEDRADYFLDPWNSPYWIRDRCKKKDGKNDRSRRATFVYSFGPNRKRDSTRWDILGDDIGLYIRKLRPSS